MFCTKCGSPISVGMSFCSNCGKPIASEVVPNVPIPIKKTNKVIPTVIIAAIGFIILIALGAFCYQAYTSPKNMIIGSWSASLNGNETTLVIGKDNSFTVQMTSDTLKGTYSLDTQNKKLITTFPDKSNNVTFTYKFVDRNTLNLTSGSQSIDFKKKN